MDLILSLTAIYSNACTAVKQMSQVQTPRSAGPGDLVFILLMCLLYENTYDGVCEENQTENNNPLNHFLPVIL